MSGLPADWGMYYRVCETCDEEYHLSGTVECACRPCVSVNCDDAVGPDNEDGTCDGCREHQEAIRYEETTHAMDELSTALNPVGDA
jgi:hypothetical protein